MQKNGTIKNDTKINAWKRQALRRNGPALQESDYNIFETTPIEDPPSTERDSMVLPTHL